MPDDSSSSRHKAAPIGRAQLFAYLDGLNIATVTYEHAAVFTVEESIEVEHAIAGGHTKNLFLKDAKGALFLVIAESRAAVDLRALARRLGAGRFSFGRADLLSEVLGVTPGSVTAFALVNDVEGRVTAVIDATLLRHDAINCHPLENTATTSIARDDLLRFIRATGHEPIVVSLGGD